MATVPTLMPTTVHDETFAGVTYHIEGELVPVLHVELNQTPIYFEHHILLWKQPQVEIGLKAMKGAFKRALAGMPIFLTEARGPGQIGFSRDGAGHIFALHLRPGEAVDVREHQFLAATSTLDYSFTRVKGVANMLMGGTGFFIDTFAATQADGILFLHGYGNVFGVVLQPGESIDVEPGGWLYKDRSVQMNTIPQRFSTGFFASAGQITFNRFTGPGRLVLQSMYLHMPTEEK